MQRRELISTIPALALGASGIFTSNEADAFIPFLLRILLGGVLRGTVARVVAPNIVRRLVTTASLGLRASGILAVSSDIALAYEKHRASEIWVAGRAEQPLIVSTQQGTTMKREQVYLGYRVIDAETGNIEKIGLKNVSIESNKKISLSYLVNNLPYTGAKFIEGIATLDSRGHQANNQFQFTERKIVIVANLSDVESS
jgi:hypothetical protein